MSSRFNAEAYAKAFPRKKAEPEKVESACEKFTPGQKSAESTGAGKDEQPEAEGSGEEVGDGLGSDQ